MRLFHKIPFSARHTYYYELRYAILDGFFQGAGLNFINYVGTKTVGVSEWQLTVLLCGNFVGMLLATVLPGMLRLQRKVPYIVTLLVVSRAPFFLLPFLPGRMLYTGLSMVVLSAAVAIGSAYAGLLRSNYPDSHRATIMSGTRRWQLLVLCVSNLLVGKLLDRHEPAWRWVFPLAGAVGLGSVWMFSRIRARGERREIARGCGLGDLTLPRMWRVVRGNRRFLWYELFFGMGGTPNIMTWALNVVLSCTSWRPIRQADRPGAAAPQVMMVLTYPFWGRVLDRWNNPIWARTLHTAVWAVHPLACALAYYAHEAGWPHALGIVYFGVIVLGSVMGGSGINWTVGIMYFCRREEVAYYSAFHHLMNAVRGFPARFLGFVIWRWLGVPGTYLLSTGMMLGASGGMLWLYYYDRRISGAP
ncbi:hypothetical protein HS125_10810 [bacterium]|nr:hypothetical protein [bacterium]